jgi:hypothetical protein
MKDKKQYYNVENVKGIDSVNLLGLFLSLNSHYALSDINDRNIVGITKLRLISNYVHDDERERFNDVIDDILLLRVSRGRKGRKELLKLSKLSKNIVSVFQKRKVNVEELG